MVGDRLEHRAGSTTSQLEARLAGFAYLSTIASGLFAEAFVRGSIRTGVPASTAARIVDLEQLYRFGILADGIMLISYVIVTVLLYRLFKPVNATLSLLGAGFSLIGIAILAASLTILVVPLRVDPSLAHDALRVHSASYSLTGLFFGPYCALLGWLVLRSRWLPSWIGWLMLLAGLTFVIDASTDLVAPGLARQIPDGVMLISLIAEGSLAIWLAAIGVRPGAGAPSREATSHA